MNLASHSQQLSSFPSQFLEAFKKMLFNTMNSSRSFSTITLHMLTHCTFSQQIQRTALYQRLFKKEILTFSIKWRMHR
ncbi:hypothetical protein FGO68_gene17207 [Halteria grandinella]|uniref:Uncharacterized protein n=1 Tax=Halteria grandinella TaxID=5974 RepID=A0A8J8T2H4_HALGN|nr:hypothetical protein FGO68_gene17207 [Halteria grandinella]